MNKIRGWIASDKDGGVYFYDEKPNRGNVVWLPMHEALYLGDCKQFNITWKDEPIKVELTVNRL